MFPGESVFVCLQSRLSTQHVPFSLFLTRLLLIRGLGRLLTA